MTPEFSKLVDPIFQAVLGVVARIESGEGVDLEAERTELRTLIDEADRSVSASASRVSQENFQLAKRGLIYWIDEVLTVAAPSWKAIILEWEYYSERERAWRFYVEGERSARHSSPDVTETWYLALALGFKGDIDYAFKTALKRALPGGKTDPDEARRSWAAELARRIRDSQLPDLTPEPLRGDVAPLKGRKFFYISLALVIGLSATAAGLYWYTHDQPESTRSAQK
jgi:Type VI secretion system protein DotU